MRASGYVKLFNNSPYVKKKIKKNEAAASIFCCEYANGFLYLWFVLAGLLYFQTLALDSSVI